MTSPQSFLEVASGDPSVSFDDDPRKRGESAVSEGYSIKFTITGRYSIQDQTDMDTGEVKKTKGGSPVKVTIIPINLDAENQRGKNGVGPRRLFLTGTKAAAFAKAVREAGAADLEVGAKGSLTWASTDKPTQRGYSGLKRFTATYEAPAGTGGSFVEAAASEAPATAGTDEPPF